MNKEEMLQKYLNNEITVEQLISDNIRMRDGLKYLIHFNESIYGAKAVKKMKQTAKEIYGGKI